MIKFDSSFWIRAAFIALLTLLAYATVYHAGFIWDDDDYVTGNPYLRSFEGLTSIWLEPGATPQYYPMVFTIFWLQYHLWGLDPIGFHLVNIFLHIGNALLLWICARRLRIPGAFWAAAIFAVHPVQVESVAWITELKNVLSTTFYFLAFISYCRFSELSIEEPGAGRRVWSSYGLALFFFLFALFSKTVAGSLPAAILLVFWWRQDAFPWKDTVRLLPFFILAAVLGKHTAHLEIHRVLAIGPEWDLSFMERLLIAGRAVWFYLAKLFWPCPLIFSYPRWHIDSGQWWQYLFPAGIGLLLPALWFSRKKIGKGPLVAALFFVGTLFPALGFFNVYPMRFSFVADHFQYLACVGIIVFFCAVLDHLFRKKSLQRYNAEVIFYAAILLTFSFLVWQQGKIYKGSLELFGDVIAKNPSSWMGYNNRGSEYFLQGKFNLAMADFQKSLALNPNNVDALNNRALIYLRNRDYDKALSDLNKSISVRPWRFDFYGNRSKIFWETGRYDLALADCTKALQLNANYPEGYLRRGLIYGMREDYVHAVEDFSQALRIDPADADGYANRGLVYYRQGLMRQAINDFDRALSIKPDSAPTYYNRGLAYGAAGWVDLATADFERARKLGYALPVEEMQKVFARRTK